MANQYRGQQQSAAALTKASQASFTTTHLVNDATARLPETNAVLGSCAGQEVIHLLVGLDSMLQICHATKSVVSASKIECCFRA